MQTVDALVVSLRDQLPNKVCYQLPEDVPWSLLQGQPEEADDYPARQDTITAVSMMPEGLLTFLSGRSFYSECYSRFKERFCYVKIDGKDGLDQEKFPDRESIENALNEVLKPAKLGCVVGAGT